MSFKTTGPSLGGLRVLVIEDTIENLRLFRAILRLENAEILEADNAQKGINLAKSEQPDVILMDMQMPEIDGLEATRLLRADESTRHIPIIVVTASAMLEDRKRAIEAGCTGYITKPIDPMNLGKQIIQFLSDTPQASAL